MLDSKQTWRWRAKQSVTNIKTPPCTRTRVLQSSFKRSALPSCLPRVTEGALLFSQVFQVTTNRQCRHSKQDVAAKQEPPENKNEFSPALSDAAGRSHTERMSGCLCIIFQGAMTIFPIVSPLHLALKLIPISVHLWWLITLQQGAMQIQMTEHVHIWWKLTVNCYSLSKQSEWHSEWRQQKTTAVAVWEAQASCSDAITSSSLACSSSMNGGCKTSHVTSSRSDIHTHTLVRTCAPPKSFNELFLLIVACHYAITVCVCVKYYDVGCWAGT